MKAGRGRPGVSIAPHRCCHSLEQSIAAPWAARARLYTKTTAVGCGRDAAGGPAGDTQ